MSLATGKSLRVVHVVEDFGHLGGGVATAVRALHSALRQAAVDSRVLHVTSGEEGGDDSGRENATTHSALGRRWRYSPSLPSLLERHVHGLTVVHVHGMWMAPQWQALGWARSRGAAVVLSPHNMIGGWLWRRSLWKRAKKAAYLRGFLGRRLKAVTCIHALSSVEAETLQSHLPWAQVQTLPNGLSFPEVSPSEPSRYLLFLGRLAEGKGLRRLLRAFSEARLPFPWELRIAGDARSAGFEQELRGLVKGAPVRFLGRVSGVEKWRQLAGAWAVCHLSQAEGVSMVAIEAGAAACPLIATPAVGVEGLTGSGGVELKADSSVASVLREVADWSLTERLERGRRYAHHCRQRYDWQHLLPEYLKLYENVLTARSRSTL